jgi:hypothetical protein
MMKPSPRRFALLKPSCLLLTLLLPACSSAEKAPPVVTVVDPSCFAFGQISWSVRDTPETSTQIRKHNRIYADLCPRKP